MDKLELELEEEGRLAFLDDKKESDNPFNAFKSPEFYSAWKYGYRMEKQYWELAVADADLAFDRNL